MITGLAFLVYYLAFLNLEKVEVWFVLEVLDLWQTLSDDLLQSIADLEVILVKRVLVHLNLHQLLVKSEDHLAELTWRQANQFLQGKQALLLLAFALFVRAILRLFTILLIRLIKIEDL